MLSTDCWLVAAAIARCDALPLSPYQSVGSYYGMLKVIPPPEHVPNKSGFADVSLKEMLVQNPARQRVQAVQGYPGAFQVANEGEMIQPTLPHCCCTRDAFGWSGAKGPHE